MRYRFITPQELLAKQHIPQEYRGIADMYILEREGNVYLFWRHMDVHSGMRLVVGFRQIIGGNAGWDVYGPELDDQNSEAPEWWAMDEHFVNHGRSAAVTALPDHLLDYLIEANEAHCINQLEFNRD